MKRRLAAVTLALALVLTLIPAQIFAAATDIEDPAVYYTPSSDYKSGDCILTATKVMLRRACILRGKEWSNITNESLRGLATVSGLLLWSFTVDVNSVKYKVSHGSFSSDKKKRTDEIASLLSRHPEGIVVHGANAAAKGGAHGVLVVRYNGGVLYAADSTNNLGSKNCGIQRWQDTTMKKDLGNVTAYWYIESAGPGESIEGSVNGTQVSKLRIKSYNAPKKIKKGKGYTVKGTVKSNQVISNVTLQITDVNGKVIYSASAAPGKKSYSIKKPGKQLKFRKLQKGTYYYKVTATDTLKTKTLVKKKFKKK